MVLLCSSMSSRCICISRKMMKFLLVLLTFSYIVQDHNNSVYCAIAVRVRRTNAQISPQQNDTESIPTDFVKTTNITPTNLVPDKLPAQISPDYSRSSPGIAVAAGFTSVSTSINSHKSTADLSNSTDSNVAVLPDSLHENSTSKTSPKTNTSSGAHQVTEVFVPTTHDAVTSSNKTEPLIDGNKTTTDYNFTDSGGNLHDEREKTENGGSEQKVLNGVDDTVKSDLHTKENDSTTTLHNINDPQTQDKQANRNKQQFHVHKNVHNVVNDIKIPQNVAQQDETVWTFRAIKMRIIGWTHADDYLLSFLIPVFAGLAIATSAIILVFFCVCIRRRFLTWRFRKNRPLSANVVRKMTPTNGDHIRLLAESSDDEF